jgi:uncharacterized protein (TIGR02466 family)
MIDVTPFEPIIFKAHFDNFDWNVLESICRKMIEGVDSKNDGVPEEQGGFSSVHNRMNQPHFNEAFHSFYEWLKPIADDIIYNKWGYDKSYRYGIGNTWVNVHGKSGTTLEHNHGECPLVVAAYLQIEEGNGYIQYKDPLEYIKAFRPKSSLIKEWETIPAITGDVLLFPGWIRHKTQPNLIDKERWVLTTNLISR